MPLNLLASVIRLRITPSRRGTVVAKEPVQFRANGLPNANDPAVSKLLQRGLPLLHKPVRVGAEVEVINSYREYHAAQADPERVKDGFAALIDMPLLPHRRRRSITSMGTQAALSRRMPLKGGKQVFLGASRRRGERGGIGAGASTSGVVMSDGIPTATDPTMDDEQ